MKVGQFKAPWLREELVSSSRQLAVERSIVNEYFNQGFSQGIELSRTTDDFKIAAWTGDGIGARGIGSARFNSQNTGWFDTDTSYSFVGRGEWKMAGEWGQFDDFSSPRGSEFGAMLGLSGFVQRANQRFSYTDGTLGSGVTADLTLDFDGASLFVSGIYTNVTTPMSQGGGADPGRDHHIKGFSFWMAGGGIKGGISYGNTDEFGYNAVEDVVTVHDFHATMLQLLGIQHEKFTYKFQGLDFRLTGVEEAHVLKKILA